MEHYDIDLELGDDVRVTWRPTPPPPRNAEPAHAMSQREVGVLLGLSGNRIRQIESTALQKCLAWCEQHGYRLDDLLP